MRQHLTTSTMSVGLASAHTITVNWHHLVAGHGPWVVCLRLEEKKKKKKDDGSLRQHMPCAKAASDMSAMYSGR